MALYSLDELVTDVNRAYEEITGYPRDELIGTSVTKVLTPAGIAVAAERTRRAKAGEKVPRKFDIEVEGNHNYFVDRNHSGKVTMSLG